jgi:hypothetical protein
MSSMAKIFVVVNLVLVVVVFGSAATGLGAQDDYRAQLEKTTKQAMAMHNAQKNQIKSLRVKAGTQKAEASLQSGRADDAELRLLQANKNLEGATQVNAQLTSANERFTGELAALRTEIEKQQSTVAAAASESKDSNQKYQDAKKQWEEEVRNRSALEGRVQELDDTVRSLQADSNGKDKKIRELQFFVSKAKEMGFDPGTVGSNGADGVVMTVQEVAGGGIVVVISVGSADGVKSGDEYKLSRGKQFVGFIKITKVYKDKAVGEFDTNNKGDGAPPVAQDRAYTK